MYAQKIQALICENENKVLKQPDILSMYKHVNKANYKKCIKLKSI